MIQEEIKLPYKLFVSPGQSPLHALSWRIRTMEVQRLPNAWILLIGHQPSSMDKTIYPENEISLELGKQLAQTNYGILTGFYPNQSSNVGQVNYSFSFTFKSASYPGNIKDFVRYYVLQNEEVHSDDRVDATILTFLNSDRLKLLECVSIYANAALLLGGDDTDFDLALKCLRNGRPVFPIVDSGGAAKQFYDLLLENYNEEVKETSFFGANINLKNIYQHPLDVEALDRPYKSAIAEIISHLNMIYTPDDPRMYSFE